VLFSGKEVKQAREHLEALRQTIESAPFILRSPSRPRRRPESPPPIGPRQRLAVTVSIGVAGADGVSAKPDEIVQLADEALYRAKQAGRNQVRT
jgi:diguanylate cyclase (GGDEF)-like protein